MRPSLSRCSLAPLFALVWVAALVGCSDADTTDGSTTGVDVASDLQEPETDVPDPDADPGPDDGPCVDLGEGAPCDDGDPCTEDDQCAEGFCVGGVNVVCDSDDPCQEGTCDRDEGCVYEGAEEGSPCAMACFSSASCVGGDCLVDPGSAVVCPSPDEPCVHQLSCDPSTGDCSIRIDQPEGVSCNTDGDVCTLELCDGAGECVDSGEVEICQTENLNNPCWTWTCTKKTGCIQSSFVEGASCSDNNACTYSDTCITDEAGQDVCLGVPIPIDDENPCTDDACIDGQTLHTPLDGAICQAEGLCAGAGLCEGSVCKPSSACSCAVDADCAVADACGGDVICDTSGPVPVCALVPDTGVQCPISNDPCHQNVCDPQTGDCAMWPTPEGSPCDDGDTCTIGEACASGLCQGGVVVNCLDDNPCTSDSCNPASGCSHEPNDNPCTDGDACTVGDACVDGLCAGGAAAGPCDDGNSCTDDICDDDLGCVHLPNADPCDDGNACSEGDTCAGTQCVGGPATSCDDTNPCTDDGCDLVLGCLHAPNADPCDDGDACTLTDGCLNGVCVGEGAPECDDQDPCTHPVCDAIEGCGHEPFDGPCEDGDPCTLADLCLSGFCVPGALDDCDDDNSCTADSCVTGQGCVHQGADEEICDGLDNDCDGGVDEDEVCPPGTEVSGMLECDATWTTDMSPILVMGNILVPDGCVLNIEAGVVVKVAQTTSCCDKHYIQILGTLVANGNLDAPIIFAAMGSAPGTEDWAGVWFEGPASQLRHVHFYHAGGNTEAGDDTALWLKTGGHTIEDCRFFNCGDAITIQAGADPVTVNGTSFEKVSRGLFLFNASDASFQHNRFHQAKTPVYVTSSWSGSSLLFSHNELVDSDSDGWRCDGPAPNMEVSYNVFDGTGFFLLSKCAPYVHHNHLITNGDPIFQVHDFNSDPTNPVEIDAGQNWWGQEVTQEMEDKGPDANISVIDDFYDNFAEGRVTYEGWLTEPVPDVGP